VSYQFVARTTRGGEHISHRVTVMHLGRIVELVATEATFTRAQHSYTVALLSAVPISDPRVARKRIILAGRAP